MSRCGTKALNPNFVIPAQAGIQFNGCHWIPACAGMTKDGVLSANRLPCPISPRVHHRNVYNPYR